jgi:hypothetical protein
MLGYTQIKPCYTPSELRVAGRWMIFRTDKDDRLQQRVMAEVKTPKRNPSRSEGAQLHRNTAAQSTTQATASQCLFKDDTSVPRKKKEVSRQP